MSEVGYPTGPIGSLIASQTGGGTPSRQNPAFWTGPIPWASVKDFAEGETELLTTEERISQQGLQASATNLIPANTPIVCTRMAVGRVAVAPMDLAINQDLKALTPARGVSTRYLLRLADYAKPKAEAVSVGSTVKGIKVSDYLNTQVPLAPLPYQPKIAEVLDTLDAAIRGTEAVVAKLRAMKQGLLHDLLTRGIDANGDLRPPQPEAPHLYHQTPLGWLPKEWEPRDVFSVSSTVTSGSRDWARYYSEHGAVFVRIGNLTREHVNLRLGSLIYVRPPMNADGQRTSLEAGDVLVSITADLGIVGVIPEGFGEAYINQHIALVRPNANIINARFLGHFLASPASQNHLSKLNDAGAKAGLNLPTIRGLPVMLPERSEQDAIAERLDEIDGQIAGTLTELAKLRSLKSGLLDDLLTGRVSVTPLL